MRTSFLLSSAFALLGTTALAALPPNAKAPFSAHLLEVNAQWKAQGFVPIDASRTVDFSNEAARIGTHLHLVRAQLTAHAPEGLSASQLNNRLALLARLDRYADRGLFPQNKVLPYRNPVFIDPKGTACAVGQLIIESGHRDLAERISAEMNLAYLLDMPSSPLWPEIASWANEHGFTAEELAWIQPGYPPMLPWFPLGGGTNGTVRVLKELANGDLLVAGDFTEAGGTTVNHVAIWNGSTYVALDNGVQGTVNCAVEFNGALYLGGAMLDGWSDLAMWNGSSWNYSVVFDGKYPLITALHVHNGELYAAGAMSGFAGSTDLVQKLVGGGWSPVGSSFDEPVLALTSHNGSLIAGGAFMHTQTPSLPPPVMHVAEFNGTDWVQLGDGLDAPVRTLLDVDGTLYAGGDLYANVAPVFGMARIASGSPYWEMLLPNHVDYMNVALGNAYISSLVAHDGAIYFGGYFSINLWMTYGTHVGRFGGTADDVMPLIFLDAPVNAVAITGNQLVIGGEFEAGLPHIAILDLTASTNDRVDDATLLQIAPNPTTDELRVRVNDAKVVSAPVLFDASGRQVAVPFQRRDDGYRTNIAALPAGAYLIQVVTSDGPVNARFVKE